MIVLNKRNIYPISRLTRMSIREQLVESLAINTVDDLDTIELSDVEEEDEIMENLYEDLLALYSTRFLQHNGPIPKSSAWFVEVLPELDNYRFKTMMRITRFQFSIILDLIEASEIFHTTKNQFSVPTQLAIMLYRIGAYGSGCSVAKLAQLFGIGDGATIDRITKRVFKALMSIESRFICWPNPEERKQIVTENAENLPNCVGFLDGCEINLAESPSLDHASYYSRKQRYSIKLQAICDYNLKIRNLHIGYPGSVHDARIFSNSDVGKNPAKYFNGVEWVAADSAYKLCSTVLTPFRKNSTFKTLRQREKFNKYFSSYRVKIEQCFGILKQKFASLKELRIRIRNKKSHALACKWILACVIVQNILLPYYDDEDFQYDNDTSDNSNEDDSNDERLGSTKREALFTILEPNI